VQFHCQLNVVPLHFFLELFERHRTIHVLVHFLKEVHLLFTRDVGVDAFAQFGELIETEVMVFLKAKNLKEFFDVDVLFLDLEPQGRHDSFEFVLKLGISL
jgi:hypothetical protein